MPRYDYSGCFRDGPIAAMDTHGCGKYGGIKGGGRKQGDIGKKVNTDHLK